MPATLLSVSVHLPDTASTSEAAEIRKFYSADDWTAVEKHFQRDPASLAQLMEGHAWLSRIFGEGVPVSLKVVPDADGHDSPMLFARIQTQADWRSAQDKLDRFDAAWWLNASAGMESHLEFVVANQ